MTLGNMREQGVYHLIGFCHNDTCRHQALIDVSDCPDHAKVRWFRQRAKCAKWGGKRSRYAAELERAIRLPASLSSPTRAALKGWRRAKGGNRPSHIAVSCMLF
jgi:hypothetical protein